VITKRLNALQQCPVSWSLKYPGDASIVAGKEFTSKKLKMSLLGYGDCLMWLAAKFPGDGKLSLYLYASSSSSECFPSPHIPLDISGSSITLFHRSDSKNNTKMTFSELSAISRSGGACGWHTFVANVHPFVNRDDALRIDAVFRISQPKCPLIL
jgi:hypothetical protein